MRLPGTPKYIVEGQVFLSPHNGQFIMAQVCEGLDLAIFDGLWDDVQQVEELGSPLFRVHFGYPTARGHGWKIAGEQPLANGLERAASYSHSTVGSDECYRVTDGNDDQLISSEEANSLEPLATWSHEHIVRRFDDPSYRA